PRRLRGSGTASSTSASVGRSAAGSVRVRCSRWRESTLIGDDGTRTRPLFLIDWLRQPTIIRGRVCHLSSGVPSSACPGQGWGRLTSRERIGLGQRIETSISKHLWAAVDDQVLARDKGVRVRISNLDLSRSSYGRVSGSAEG